MLYKELDVWKDSIIMVVDVYRLTKGFPKHELYGLSSQMQRAAISIPSNIAEGAGRKTTKEFIQLLYVSKGSLQELETQIEIARLLGYVVEVDAQNNQIKAIRNQINELISSLERKL
jgi:four helix bundle protein